MGLERIVAVTEGTLSNYDTDVFGPLLAAIADRTRARPAQPWWSNWPPR